MKSVSQHVNPEKLHLAVIMLEADARAVEMRRCADCFNKLLSSGRCFCSVTQ